MLISEEGIEGEINPVALDYNSFNSAGILHNEAMDYIFSRASTERDTGLVIDNLHDLTIYILDITKDFLENKVVIVGGIVITGKDMQYPTPQELANLINDYYAGNNLHPTVSKCFDFVRDNGEEYSKLDSLIESIRERSSGFEALGKSDSELPLSTYYGTNTANAIMDFSVEYWYSRRNNFCQAPNLLKRDPRDVNWLSVGYADASGAYGGAAYGAVLGPGGAVGGAIAMGVLSSATALSIDCIWNDWF